MFVLEYTYSVQKLYVHTLESNTDFKYVCYLIKALGWTEYKNEIFKRNLTQVLLQLEWYFWIS